MAWEPDRNPIVAWEPTRYQHPGLETFEKDTHLWLTLLSYQV